MSNMTTPAERDLQKHEAQHPGCNERYWRERALSAEQAIVTAVEAERQACIADVERAGDKQPASVSTVQRTITLIRARQGRRGT
jgi:hypothetical protein